MQTFVLLLVCNLPSANSLTAWLDHNSIINCLVARAVKIWLLHTFCRQRDSSLMLRPKRRKKRRRKLKDHRDKLHALVILSSHGKM